MHGKLLIPLIITGLKELIHHIKFEEKAYAEYFEIKPVTWLDSIENIESSK